VKESRGAESLGWVPSQRTRSFVCKTKTSVELLLVDVADLPPDFAGAGFTRVPAVLHSNGTSGDENVSISL